MFKMITWSEYHPPILLAITKSLPKVRWDACNRLFWKISHTGRESWYLGWRSSNGLKNTIRLEVGRGKRRWWMGYLSSLMRLWGSIIKKLYKNTFDFVYLYFFIYKTLFIYRFDDILIKIFKLCFDMNNEEK